MPPGTSSRDSASRRRPGGAARSVMEVKGNITADDKVEVAATGTMRGDIRAPRVVLADGARFKGSVKILGKT